MSGLIDRVLPPVRRSVIVSELAADGGADGRVHDAGLRPVAKRERDGALIELDIAGSVDQRPGAEEVAGLGEGGDGLEHGGVGAGSSAIVTGS